MARGRTARSYATQKKAEVKAELKAKTEHKNKIFMGGKVTKEWLIEQLERHADKIPKYVAIAGMTMVVKATIDASEVLRGKLDVILKGGNPFKGMFVFESGVPVFGLGEGADYEGMFPDWMDWLIAFGLAYVIVEHAGSLIGLLGDTMSGLTGVLGFLMG